MLLTEQLLPVMREISGEFFIFQQDSECSSTPSLQVNQPSGMGDTSFYFTRPVAASIPDLNLVDYRIRGDIQQRLYENKVGNVHELK